MASPIPPLRPDLPPLAFLVDYDGTIALNDVSDAIMAPHVDVPWEAWNVDYGAGRAGSRRLMTLEVASFRGDPQGLLEAAAEQPHDDGFAPFVARARAAGIPVEVVSDGFGFFIEPALARLGVGDVPVTTALTTFEGGRPKIEFPNGHPDCFVCGTCKRNRVLAHRATGRRVVFVGDGESDRYAAAHADLVFAKRSLVGICSSNGWPWLRWDRFAEIEAWLADRLDAWRADPAALPPPGPKAPWCGPEVWGPGLVDPPPSLPATHESPID